MDEQRRRQIVTGVILAVLGVGLFALQYAHGFGEAAILFAIGGLLVAGYLYWGTHGLLVAGGIMLGLGLGAIGKRAMVGAADFDAIGLGVGFVGIYVIALVYAGRSHWWPLIPGAVLILAGMVWGDIGVEHPLRQSWPLILVVIGLVLLLSAAGFKRRWNVVLIIVVGLVALAWASAMRLFAPLGSAEFTSAERYSEDFQHTYPLKPGGRFSVETFNGAIEVSGWGQDAVEISGSKYAAIPELRDAIRIDIVATPDAIAVRTIRPSERRDNMGARYLIKVPRQTELERLTSSNAAIRVTGVEGSGRISTSNGLVRVVNMRGDLDLQTSNAAVEVQNLEGSAVVRTSNGGIGGAGVRGAFEAYTSNGGINVQMMSSELGGAVTLETSNGGVELSLDADPRHDVRVSTNNGGITVRLPASIGARVRARTSNAAISTDFTVKMQGTISQNHLEGTVGDGGAVLDLSTSNGNIRLLKR